MAKHELLSTMYHLDQLALNWGCGLPGPKADGRELLVFFPSASFSAVFYLTCTRQYFYLGPLDRQGIEFIDTGRVARLPLYELTCGSERVPLPPFSRIHTMAFCSCQSLSRI